MTRFFRMVAVFLVLSGACSGAAAQKKETFWERLFRVFGISATSNKQKGGSGAAAGEIWLADLVIKENSLVKLVDDVGYRSPIFTYDQMILALKGENIIRMSIKGKNQQTLHRVSGIVKLIGYSVDDKDNILLLRADQDKHLLLGFFSLTKNEVVEELRLDEKKDRDLIDYVMGEKRDYSDTTLYVEEDKEKELSNVFWQWDNNLPVGITQCSVRCGQPSLSPKGRYVVYIKGQK